MQFWERNNTMLEKYNSNFKILLYFEGYLKNSDRNSKFLCFTQSMCFRIPEYSVNVILLLFRQQ